MSGTPPNLDDLSKRLAAARAASEKKEGRSNTSRSELPSSMFGMAMRIGLELVVGVAVGAGIGYGLDHLLGTKPWMMILFFFIGAAAGMLNVWRAATGQGMAVGYARQSPPETDDSAGAGQMDGEPGERERKR